MARGRLLSGRAWLAAILPALALMAVAVMGFIYFGPGPRAAEGPATTVILPRGAGVGRIASELEQAHVIRSRLVFALMAKLSGASRSLKAGEYEIASGESMARVLADVRAGRVVRHLISIPEGWTSEAAVAAVNAAPWLTGYAEVPPEGSLLPETYQVERGEDRAQVIARMRRARDKLLAELWAQRRVDVPLKTPEEAVILASVVEKETGIPEERLRIAAVFENRLRAGMRLESDPTVIYGISNGRRLGRGITATELADATPYNTYKIQGLPPTPIANPGRAALEAVLNPPDSNELFFVATGDGGHVFASSFQEHQKNVARWREVERARAAAAGAMAR